MLTTSHICHSAMLNTPHSTKTYNTEYTQFILHVTLYAIHISPYTPYVPHVLVHTVHSRYIHKHPSITHKTFHPLTIIQTSPPLPAHTCHPSNTYHIHLSHNHIQPQEHTTEQCNTNTQIHKRAPTHHAPSSKQGVSVRQDPTRGSDEKVGGSPSQ